MTVPTSTIGSVWQRWDPHLHAPGTLLNDQFAGDWAGYLRALGAADPPVVALGITDYSTLASYKEVKQRHAASAIPNLQLLFANIELRLTIETRDGPGINLHLIVSPDDSDHVTKMETRLARLYYTFRGERYALTDANLVALGRAYRGNSVLEVSAARREGANQFKVEVAQLKELMQDSWMSEHVLVGISGGADGLGGLSKDDGFGSLREELGRFAHFIFSPKPSDRAYWLGNHQGFIDAGHFRKPCLHGSDAHRLDKVLKPDEDRYCWIRGEATFDSLRQALVEPERRTWIGPTAPTAAAATNVIKRIHFQNASWMSTSSVAFNDSLVSIIGAKGSGKTALADLIAVGCDAQGANPSEASFLKKAGPLLGELQIKIEWGDGTVTEGSGADCYAAPRVRYLSQQFVEQLCGSTDLADELVTEIEQVVFQAIPIENRLGCGTFDEYAEIRLRDCTSERRVSMTTLSQAIETVGQEEKLAATVSTLLVNAKEMRRQREEIEKTIRAIPVSAKDAELASLSLAQERLTRLQAAIASNEKRATQLKDLKAELTRWRNTAAADLDRVQRQYPDLVDNAVWTALTPALPTEPVTAIAKAQEVATRIANQMRTNGIQVEDPKNPGGPKVSSGGLQALAEEVQRLTKTLGLTEANAKRRTDLDRQLTVARTAETRAEAEHTHAAGAPERRKAAFAARAQAYNQVFAAMTVEEEILRELYGALMRRCASHPSLAKLAIVVERSVDVDAWAEAGAELFDFRKTPFKRADGLAKLASEHLVPAWRRGSADEIAAAMRSFVEQHAASFVESLLPGKTRTQLGAWVYSVEHIQVRYGIAYEGVPLSRLSPGTRGVVLLTLYLALDDQDRRPLIVDQPEENLDPRSVYLDLMPFFREAAKRRQIIMVTHNANLVVNCDSDQVIIASAARSGPGRLPTFQYASGGLEQPWVRSSVCDLLEGGDAAFRMRSQRYRVSSE